MQMIIDDKSVSARPGESVLRCALRHGIDIPHLCTHPSLPAFGACRMCVVEVDGIRGFPTSCTTPAAEGMVVRTVTPALQELRRGILELILLEHPSACLVCEKEELCERFRPHAAKAGRTTSCHTCNNKEGCEVRDLAQELGLTELPVPPLYRDLPLERSDPFIDRDLNLCILCGRCVRICKEHHGGASIAFVGRGPTARIGQAFGRSLADAGCQFCGSCVDVCPTGSLSDRYGKWFGAPTRYTATTCMLCDEACAVTVRTSSSNSAVAARAIDTRHPICVLGRFAIPELLNGGDRLTAPQMRVGNVLRETSWAEALAQAAERLKVFVGQGFALVSDGSITLEDRWIFRRFTREVMKSPHYIELPADQRDRYRSSLPSGVRAALITGDLIDERRRRDLELLMVQDCYPTAASKDATFSLPAAVLTEIDGTWIDGAGLMRPLHRASKAPGQAKPDWQILCELARLMGAAGFDYQSAAEVAAAAGLKNARLHLHRETAAAPATDHRRRRIYFRGHRLDERVGGLRDLGEQQTAIAAPAAATAGG